MTPAPTARRWLLTPTGATAGAPELYCFPHAGGNPAEYARWAEGLGDTTLHVVRLPGRAGRHREPHAATLAALVRDFITDVPLGNGPFSFFGHSLGALVAYEITRALHTTGRPLPDRLIVSALPAPAPAAPRASLAHPARGRLP